MSYSVLMSRRIYLRTILGFWAGHRNSRIRVILARVWENDTELAISNNRINRAIGELVYQKTFYRTKFCICPGGSQVNSARITDSIHYGCVPGEYFLGLLTFEMGCWSLKFRITPSRTLTNKPFFHIYHYIYCLGLLDELSGYPVCALATEFSYFFE